MTFVRAKLAANDVTLATTVYVPPVPLAVKAGAAAMPELLVSTLTLITPPANVPEAPLAGAVKVTPTPWTGLPEPPLAKTLNAVENAVFAKVFCDVPDCTARAATDEREVFNRTDTVLREDPFALTTSNLPSLLKSPMPMDRWFVPELNANDVAA